MIENASIERQTEIVTDQLALCLDVAGATFETVLTCSVYCSRFDFFPRVNAVYARYFTVPPARIFLNIPAWPAAAGRFDIEVDCIAARAHTNE